MGVGRLQCGGDACAAARSRYFCVDLGPPLPLGSGKLDRAGRGRAALLAAQKVDWLAVPHTSADMCRLAGWGVARGLAAAASLLRPCLAANMVPRELHAYEQIQPSLLVSHCTLAMLDPRDWP